MRSGPTPEIDRLTPARGICECEDHFKVEECKGQTVSSVSGSLDWTLKGGGGLIAVCSVIISPISLLYFKKPLIG